MDEKLNKQENENLKTKEILLNLDENQIKQIVKAGCYLTFGLYILLCSIKEVKNNE